MGRSGVWRALISKAADVLSSKMDWLSRFASLWLMVALVAFLILYECDRLIGEMLADNGRVYQLAEVVGPLAVGNRDAWSDWATASPSPVTLIWVHIIVDVVFFVAYGLLAWRVVRRSKLGRGLLASLLILESVEAILLVIGVIALSAGEVPDGVAWSIAGVATAKCVVFLALLVCSIVGPLGRRIRDSIRQPLKALSAQGLLLIVVGFLGVVGLVPRSGVLEQIADVQRAWIRVSNDGVVTINVWAIVPAIAALAFVAFALFLVGRLRAQQFAPRRSEEGEEREDVAPKPYDGWLIYLPWAIVAGGALAMGVIVQLTSPSNIDWTVLWRFVGVLVGLILASIVVRFFQWVFRRPDRTKPPLPGDRPKNEPPSAELVRVTGDTLVALLIAFSALSLVRSFAAPGLLALYPSPDGSSPGIDEATRLSSFMLMVGIVLAIPSLSFVRGILRPIGSDEVGLQTNQNSTLRRAWTTEHDDTEGPALRRFALAFGATAGTILLCTLLFPRQVSSAFGSITMLTLILGSWATVFAMAIIFLGKARPLEIFRLVGLRATPFLTLLIAVPLVVSVLGGEPALHAIKQTSGEEPPRRSTLAVEFTRWLDRSDGCDTEVMTGAGTTNVRPLVLAAAEGGGIRAATWTVNAFRTLGADGDCARSAVMISSGVSGGSVGLTLFRDDQQIGAPTATSASRLTDEALAAAVTGALVGDVIGGLTGLRLPTSPGYTDEAGERAWQDRAAMMQASWVSGAPQLGTPYGNTVREPTGLLILNSTDALSRCKVIISQVNLRLAAGGGTNEEEESVNSCDGSEAELAGTLDLRNFVGAACPFEMDWATMAGLSARFPIVSPAGRVSFSAADAPDCDVTGDLQLIDGGYIDNSGLGTLSDLAPELAQLISDHNQTADGRRTPFVVPLVLYLRNEAGADVAAPPKDVQPELFIPISSKLNAPDLQIEPATWLTRLTQTLEHACPSVTSTDGDAPSGSAQLCRDATASVHAAMPRGIAVVAPTTTPSIEVPLGWALSDLSRERLRHAMAAQAQCRTSQTPDPATTPSHGCFGDLLALLDRVRDRACEPLEPFDMVVRTTTYEMAFCRNQIPTCSHTNGSVDVDSVAVASG